MRELELRCVKLRLARAAFVAVAAACVAAGAQARDITPAEMQALSPLCQAVFSKEGSRKERLAPFAAELTGACGVHHTCNGELAMLRYRQAGLTGPRGTGKEERSRYERRRKTMLTVAVGEYAYETRCAPPTYPLLPMIHTERGKALSLQGKHSSATKEFARALELDPDYGPARAGLAAAQARAAAPK